jgi:N-acetylgalactosamine 4-sulfate 6-O-sulfotransferase
MIYRNTFQKLFFQVKKPIMSYSFLRAGMYFMLLNDWLQVFPRSQFHIIKSENYYNNIGSTLNDTFRFLGVQMLSQSQLTPMSKRSPRSSEPMLEETKQLLDDFYRPYNLKLAELLNDQQFTWET